MGGSRIALILLSLTLSVQFPHLATGQAEEEKPKGPPDEVVFARETKDGVSLGCTYWGPEEPGKSVIPILLLHGFEENRRNPALVRFAGALQKEGHAVMTVDLPWTWGQQAATRIWRRGARTRSQPDEAG